MTDFILQTVIGVSALLLLVLLTRRAVAHHFGPRVAYALWLLPIARLIAPPIDLPRHWLPDVLVTPEPQTIVVQPVLTEEMFRGMASISETAPAPSLWDQLVPWIAPTLLSVWLIGIVIGLAWLILSQRRHMKRLLLTTRPVSDALLPDIARATRLAGLRNPPRVRLSQGQDGPLVCGLIRPLIVIPHDFEARFTPQQRRLALLHEMLHVRRGDLWTAMAMLVFRLANWPNPIAHWAWPRFRADQEAACDASVLRCMGETARGDYAETLLTAATTAGRANPATGAGLTLSLHHPVKERLMTLGSNTNTKRGVTRWALATVLLAGTAISAPLSLADDPDKTVTETVIVTPDKSVTSTKNVMRWVISDDDSGERKGFEIRETDGVKTYLRVSRDGTTEELTREELVAEYGEDFDKVDAAERHRLARIVEGEPGLTALTRSNGNLNELQTVVVGRFHEGDQSIRVEVEDGERRIFKVAPDGTETLLNLDTLGEDSEIRLKMLKNLDSARFPARIGENIAIMKSDDFTTWSEDGENSFAFRFGSDLSDTSSEARLRSAQSMLEMSLRMLGDVKDESDSADRDLRNAEKELERARKALDKAMTAMKKAGEAK